MSNAKHETIADIVAEMRKAEATWHRSEIAQLPTQYLKEWSDRIEAAHQREVAELRGCLREALSGIDEFMTRTIYSVHGEDIERWRKVLEGEKDETK